MNGRFVIIESEGRHVRLHRGFLVIENKDQEVGRVALDEVSALIGNAHGMTITSNAIVALAERGATVIINDAHHAPVAWLWPVGKHHIQLKRMNAQIAASITLKKRIWQEVVKSKIAQQAAILDSVGQPSAPLEILIRRVRAGDPENIEAQAARLYWPSLLGKDFRRDREHSGPNALLNWGYAVLRTATANAIMAAGLHPTIAIHHSNRADHLALADDLMEPFRPLVDRTVVALARQDHLTINAHVKEKLVATLTHDMATERGTTPVLVCIERLVHSIAETFLTKKVDINVPYRPLPLELA